MTTQTASLEAVTAEQKEERLTQILRELGDALLDENCRWILRLRERPISTVG